MIHQIIYRVYLEMLYVRAGFFPVLLYQIKWKTAISEILQRSKSWIPQPFEKKHHNIISESIFLWYLHIWNNLDLITPGEPREHHLGDVQLGNRNLMVISISG